MSETVRIVVDGQEHEVAAGSILASTLLELGVRRFRRSVKGEPRGPLCGMGVCQECRVTVDGRPQTRSCMIVCRDHMKVQTE
jgi:aerobic-type carbon monoxide dehydrogenase small subunit (CoxS/CutS family)